LLYCSGRVYTNGGFDILKSLIKGEGALLQVNNGGLKLEGKHADETSKTNTDGPRDWLKIFILLEFLWLHTQ